MTCPHSLPRPFLYVITLLLFVTGGSLARPAWAVDGGTLRVTPANGWLAFEVISQGDNPSGDGFNYSMPGTFDGAGAWRVDASTLRVLVNHEETDAAISEVNLDLAALQMPVTRSLAVATPPSQIAYPPCPACPGRGECCWSCS